MLLVTRLTLSLFLSTMISGCSLGLFAAHSIEKLTKIEGDRYINVDLQVQVDQTLIEFRTYFTCEQELRSDAGAGVYDTWNVSPQYAIEEHLGKDFWLLKAPSCEYTDLNSYPAYLAHYESLDTTNPEVYLLNGQGKAQLISKSVRRVDKKPENRTSTVPNAYLIDEFSKNTPKLVAAYVLKREILRGELDKSGLFDRQQVSFFGSAYNNRSKPFFDNIDFLASYPNIIRSKEHWPAIHKLSSPNQDDINSLRWKKVYLRNDNGVWVFPDDNIKAPIAAFTQQSSKVAIKYNEFIFSPSDVKLIYDPDEEVIIAFDIEYPSYTLEKRPKEDWKEKKIKVQSLLDFPKAESTWRTRYHPSGTIPEGEFLVYRFNLNEPERVISKASAKKIIDRYPKKSGGYYLRYINVPSKENKIIKIGPREYHTQIRLIVDGSVIFEGPLRKLLSISLEPGKHLVEIEITAQKPSAFWLDVIDGGFKLSWQSIAERLGGEVSGDYDVLLAAVNESDSKNREVVVELTNTYKRVILFLNSAKKVRWIISNPFHVEIIAVIYGSSEVGSIIADGEFNEQTLLLPTSNLIGMDREQFYKCNHLNPGRLQHISCLQGGSTYDLRTLENFTGSRLTGYTAWKKASFIKLPEVIIKYDSNNNSKSPEIELRAQKP